MTTASAHAHDHSNFAPASRKSEGFLNYLRMLSEAFSEGLQKAHETRRNHPFADV